MYPNINQLVLLSLIDSNVFHDYLSIAQVRSIGSIPLVVIFVRPR